MKLTFWDNQTLFEAMSARSSHKFSAMWNESQGACGSAEIMPLRC
jgi:hypothetical protein